MTLPEEHVRLNCALIVAAPTSFPESVLARVRQIADSHPELDIEVAGGLTDLPEKPTGTGKKLDG
jgi:hypothetical protein